MAYYAMAGTFFVFGILYVIFGSSNLLFQMNTYLLLVTYILMPFLMLPLVITVSAVSHPKKILATSGPVSISGLVRNNSSEKRPYKWMVSVVRNKCGSKKILATPTTPTSANRMLTSPHSKSGESKSEEKYEVVE
jgi:hypothetical protein